MQSNANDFLAALEKLAKKINNRNVNDRLARKCREIIYRRVKDGYGVSSDKSPAESTKKVRLKELSKSYIDYRMGRVQFFTAADGHVYAISNVEYFKLMAKRGKTTKGRGKAGIGAKSSVSFGVQSVGKNFEAPQLGPFGRPAKSNATLSGEMLEAIQLRYTDTGFQLVIAGTKRKKGKLTNKQVAEFYSKDRPFFALTDGELRILTRELTLIIKQIIKEQFA